MGGLRPGLISCQRERSAQLQVRERAYGIAGHDSAIVENFPEFEQMAAERLRGRTETSMLLWSEVNRAWW